VADAPAIAAPALELRGIDKRFGQVHANRAISLAVARGSIHGPIGENGAGKSTLMNIVYGFHRADAGDIRVHGRRVAIAAPHDAIAAGIGMVHQHFMLVDTFTVLENVLLGVEGGQRPRAGSPGRATNSAGSPGTTASTFRSMPPCPICRSGCSSGSRF
jgi:simple sugar transport system ATP-binding protein